MFEVFFLRFTSFYVVTGESFRFLSNFVLSILNKIYELQVRIFRRGYSTKLLMLLINHVDEKSFTLGHDTNCEFHEIFGGGITLPLS